jgi:hypothetical protein
LIRPGSGIRICIEILGWIRIKRMRIRNTDFYTFLQNISTRSCLLSGRPWKPFRIGTLAGNHFKLLKGGVEVFSPIFLNVSSPNMTLPQHLVIYPSHRFSFLRQRLSCLSNLHVFAGFTVPHILISGTCLTHTCRNCLSRSFARLTWLIYRGRHQKRYSVIAITLCYVFALLLNALYLWRIVIALDFSLALSLLKVIALSLQVSVVASIRYRFEQHTQALALLGK